MSLTNEYFILVENANLVENPLKFEDLWQFQLEFHTYPLDDLCNSLPSLKLTAVYQPILNHSSEVVRTHMYYHFVLSFFEENSFSYVRDETYSILHYNLYLVIFFHDFFDSLLLQILELASLFIRMVIVTIFVHTDFWEWRTKSLQYSNVSSILFILPWVTNTTYVLLSWEANSSLRYIFCDSQNT